MSQARIAIEPTGEKNTGICPCCGHSSRSVWGFAYEGGACLAAYFVHWTLGHVIDRGANLDMIIGRWGKVLSLRLAVLSVSPIASLKLVHRSW